MTNASAKNSIMCVYFILKKYSDQDHVLSANRIIDLLSENYDISMDRRAVYRNIKALQDIGIDIGSYKDNGEGYYLISRELEVYDIRLLCDAIASSNMLPLEGSNEIIKKLINMMSIYEGRMLERTIYLKGKQQTDSQQIFLNIDTLLTAITQGTKVSAHLLYVDYNNKLIAQEETLILSPYSTVWAEGYYYVIALNENKNELSHYRIDRLTEIKVLDRRADLYHNLVNIHEYAQTTIINKGEHPSDFTVQIDKNLWENITEAFYDVSILEISRETLTVKITDIPFRVKKWVLENIERCEVLTPISLRDKISSIFYFMYKRYYS